MANKATSKFGCCGGCRVVPITTGSPPGEARDPHMSPLPRFCFKCLPIQICVGVHCGGLISGTLFNLSIPCDPDGHYTQFSVYRGTIPVADASADLEIWFDIVGSQCYMALRSKSLNISG